MTFADLTRLEPRLPIRSEQGTDVYPFDVEVPDGWQQGAGAFGGYVLAVLTRGAETVAPGRPLRSLTAEIPTPLQPGPATVLVEVLRAGQSATTVAARVVQKGQLQAHAVAVLGASRALDGVSNLVELTPPKIPDWRDLTPLPQGLPFIPTFARHFEFRVAEGTPFSSSPTSGTSGWIRLREPGPLKDAPLVVAHVDAWWPAELARLSRPRPIVTAAFAMQMVGGASVWTTDAPLLHTSRTQALRDGYLTEARQLWTEAGELVALNQQMLVVVK
jgi:acyl-CoA thioesterase